MSWMLEPGETVGAIVDQLVFQPIFADRGTAKWSVRRRSFRAQDKRSLIVGGRLPKVALWVSLSPEEGPERRALIARGPHERQCA